MNADESRMALAIFVKTPGHSPVKTRLASAIGQQAAEEFYRLSAKTVAALARQAQGQVPDLDVYWAVAEPQCLQHSLWREFTTIWQENGNLGTRLGRIHDVLKEKYPTVCLIGADSPQIEANKFVGAMQATSASTQGTCRLGPTEDGGFWFFGSRCQIPPRLWESVRYSTEHTAGDLVAALSVSGFSIVEDLKPEFDVDRVQDLVRLARLGPEEGFLNEQKELIRWATQTVLGLNLPGTSHD
jgi:glycosyltransferase A (GT-A) superfamily protein (DUF2064 family)